jgi:putative hydrolase of the HAD superfamily
MGGDDRRWWGAFLREVLERLQHDAPWEPLLDDLYAAFSRAEVWKLYPEVESTMSALEARGIAMVLISNWDRRLPEIIRQLGLEGFFEVITVSAIEGFEKPAPEIFTRTAERLGRLPAEILHVGDAPREDYQGAAEAGFGSVLIDRKGLFADDGFRRIASLDELLEMVVDPERTT